MTTPSIPFDLIIIGGGIGGSAAALRAAQYHMRGAWLMGNRKSAKASRGKYVYNIDNMIGVHPDIMLEKVKKSLKKKEFDNARKKLEKSDFVIGTNDIIDNARARIEAQFGEQMQIISDEIAVNISRKGDSGPFTVTTDSGRTLIGQTVMLSTGVMDRLPMVKKKMRSGKITDDINWVFPHSNLERLLYCIRCEGHLVRSRPTAVIGHQESAAQVALMLRERYGSPIHILTNGETPTFTEDSARLLAMDGIEIHQARIVDLFNEPPEMRDLPPDGTRPRVRKGSDLHGIALEDGSEIPVRYALVALGLYRVYNDLARMAGAELEAGDMEDDQRHVLVDDIGSETSVPGLYAVGDMAKRRDGGPSMKQIYTAQEYAVRAVDTIDWNLRRARRVARLAQG